MTPYKPPVSHLTCFEIVLLVPFVNEIEQLFICKSGKVIS